MIPQSGDGGSHEFGGTAHHGGHYKDRIWIWIVVQYNCFNHACRGHPLQCDTTVDDYGLGYIETTP